jgi:hypothetical protein
MKARNDHDGMKLLPTATPVSQSQHYLKKWVQLSQFPVCAKANLQPKHALANITAGAPLVVVVVMPNARTE